MKIPELSSFFIRNICFNLIEVTDQQSEISQEGGIKAAKKIRKKNKTNLRRN